MAESAAASVLFVDDEERVLKSMRAIFRREYNVLLASSGGEALDIVRANDVDVVVSDQRMPGLTGVETLAQVRQLAPRAVRILLTGYADLKSIEGSINDGEVFRFLNKPCAPRELQKTVALAARIAMSGDAPTANETEQPIHQQVAHEQPLETARGSRVLVFSRNETFAGEVSAVVSEVPTSWAADLEQAVQILASEQVGVLITDLADRDEVLWTINQLKTELPELVAIVTSERSDANQLIDLINHGQVFRFLLRPLPRGQTRLAIRSAMARHSAMVANPDLVERHRVDAIPDGRVRAPARTGSEIEMNPSADIGAQGFGGLLRAAARSLRLRFNRGK